MKDAVIKKCKFCHSKNNINFFFTCCVLNKFSPVFLKWYSLIKWLLKFLRHKKKQKDYNFALEILHHITLKIIKNEKKKLEEQKMSEENETKKIKLFIF